MGVNKIIYNNTTLIDLTGDTVTADTLAEGVVAHDKSGERIVGTMKPSSGGDNYITEVGVMIDGEPVTIRDDGSRLTTVVNADESIVETITFLDGTTSTKTTVFNADDTVTETTIADGKTTIKKTTFSDLGMITMDTTNGNQVYFGEDVPDTNVGINGDVFVKSESTPIYTPVTYIESTGTQWINTDFIPNQDTRVVMVAEFVPPSSGSSYLFGAETGSKANSFTFAGFGVRYRMIYHNKEIYFDNTSFSQPMTIDMNKNTAVVNGTDSASGTYSTFSSTYPMFICAGNRAGSAYAKLSAKIYSCKIYDNGVMVRNYIPVLDENGIACLYDVITEKCYYNEGTGSFAVGDVIEETMSVEGLPTNRIDSAMYMKINGAWTLLAEVA